MKHGPHKIKKSFTEKLLQQINSHYTRKLFFLISFYLIIIIVKSIVHNSGYLSVQISDIEIYEIHSPINEKKYNKKIKCIMLRIEGHLGRDGSDI